MITWLPKSQGYGQIAKIDASEQPLPMDDVTVTTCSYIQAMISTNGSNRPKTRHRSVKGFLKQL